MGPIELAFYILDIMIFDIVIYALIGLPVIMLMLCLDSERKPENALD